MRGFYTRKVSILRFTYSDFTEKKGKKVEDEVNKRIDELLKEGKKVVTILSQTMGLSPIYMIYTIVYEDFVSTEKEEGEA